MRALVTGAGSGAGRGIALALAKADADVAVCDIDEASLTSLEKELVELGVQTIVHRVDVTDEPAVEDMFASTGKAWDGLDVLVNTVAWIDPPRPIESTPLDHWRTGLQVNLDSVFLCTKHALPQMKRGDGGLIVNLSSVNSLRGFPNRAIYAATKVAINNFTQTTAMENREHGIRANCLMPGLINGSDRAQKLRAMAAESGLTFGDFPSFDPPMRAVTPDELGAIVVFLTREGGTAINGQCLSVGEGARMGVQALY